MTSGPGRFKTLRDQLIEDYAPMVRSLTTDVLNDYSIPDECIDSLLSEAVSALMDALEDYRPVEDGPFRQFASQKIRSRVNLVASRLGVRVSPLESLDRQPEPDFRVSLTLLEMNQFVTKAGHTIRVVLLGDEHGARVVVEQLAEGSTGDSLEMSTSFKTAAEARIYFEGIIANAADFTFSN